MRLIDSEKRGILRGLKEFKEYKSSWELYLFGSRADDSKKGGDIDLLLVVDGSDLTKLLKQKIDIVWFLGKYIDEQRIDLTIASHDLLNSDPFLKTITNKILLTN